MTRYSITGSNGKRLNLGTGSLNYTRYVARGIIETSMPEYPIKVWEVDHNNRNIYWIGTVFRDEKGKIRWSATNNPNEISVHINTDGSLRKKPVKSAYGIKGKLRPFGL